MVRSKVTPETTVYHLISANHFLSKSFRTVKLPESLGNCFKMILLGLKMNFKKNPIEKNYFFLDEKSFWKKSSDFFEKNHNGKNGWFRTNIQKTLEIEQVFVPSQYLVGAGNHICRTPNALKTS